MRVNDQTHVVETCIFEVDFFSREKALELQDRLTKLFNDRIADSLTDLFNYMILPERHFNLSSLTIDVGRFTVNWEDEEMIERIIAAVEDELSLLLNRYLSRTFSKEDPKLLDGVDHKSLQLLDHFLLHGSLPWWTASSERPDWSSLMMELFDTNQVQLRSSILSSGKLPYVRSRLARQLNDHAIYSVLQLIEPDHADYIRSFHFDLMKIQQEEQIVKTDYQSFKEAIWEFILDYLMIPNKSFFNKLHFVEATLSRFAAHFNLSYTKVLSLFTAAIPIVSRGVSTDLPELLWTLSRKNQQQWPIMDDGKSKLSEQRLKLPSSISHFEEFGFVGYYLYYGCLPTWAELEHISLSDLPVFFDEMISNSADLAIKLIRYLGKDDKARHRFLTLVPGKSLIAGVSKLFPESGNIYAAFLYLIEKLSKLFNRNELLKVEKTLASLFLKEFDITGFSGFKVDHFFRISTHYILSFTGITLDQLIKKLFPTRAKIQLKEFDKLLYKAYTDKEFTIGSISPEMDFYEYLQQIDPSLFTDSWLSDDFKYRSNHSNSECFKVLHYFLQYGRLPYQYGFTENESKQLHLNLNNYISQYWFSLDSTELLSERQSSESLALILNKSGKPHGEMLSSGEVSKSLKILNDIFKITKNLPDGWIINDTQLALKAIRYFISIGSLPSHYVFNTAREELCILRQLIKIANSEHHVSLAEIFQKVSFHRQAILKLLKLVYLPEEDAEISKILESFVERQMSNVFNDWGFDSVLTTEGISMFTVFYEVNEKRTKAFIDLLAHGQMRACMARKSSIADVLEIMDRQYASWNGEEIAESKEIYYWMVDQMHDSLEKEHLTTLFKEFFLSQLLSKHRFTDAISFFRALLKFLSSRRNVIFRQLLKAISTEEPSPVLSKALPELVRIEIGEIVKVNVARDQAEKEFLEDEVECFNLTSSSLAGTVEDVLISASFENDFELTGDSFLVRNAGLILLYPYLKTFFGNLGLLKDGKFISKKAIFKAIHALQFLIDGEQEHAEDTLILNKILCGWPVMAPVPLMVNLSATQQQHCEDFIAAVISMWKQMKNSSHANFRGSFLKRDGLLRNEGGDWSLRIEPTGHDVLLQTLPWGYSVVKNSLMETIIYVEWI